MKDKKIYFAKLIYSIYMGVIMGFIITSVFLVIITNVDKYFFNSIIGISGDWVYYLGSAILIPIFGAIYIYNKRIMIIDESVVLREKALSVNPSLMEISTIKSITLHEQVGRRKISKGIKFADGETAIMILTKPFSNSTISLFLKEVVRINPEVNIDEYYKNIMKSN